MSVDLPLDRGPATSTSPSASAHSPWISRDRPSCSAEIAQRGNHAEDAAGAAMIAERHAADAPDVGDVANPFGARLAAQRFAIALGDDVEDQRLDVGLAEHGLAVDGLDLAVDANRRARLRHQVQRRRAARGGDAKQTIDARRVGR